MAEIPQDTEFTLFGFGPKMHAQMAFVTNFLGIITVIVGIVSAALKKPIGLAASH